MKELWGRFVSAVASIELSRDAREFILGTAAVSSKKAVRPLRDDELFDDFDGYIFGGGDYTYEGVIGHYKSLKTFLRDVSFIVNEYLNGIPEAHRQFRRRYREAILDHLETVDYYEEHFSEAA